MLSKTNKISLSPAEKLLSDLKIPSAAISIFSHLWDFEELSARQIAEALGMPRPTVYDNLKILVNSGFVLEKEIDNKKYFLLNHKESIFQTIEERIETLKREKGDFEKMFNLRQVSISTEPKIQFFNGKEGIKQVLKDLLWQSNVETLTMWPISDMVNILGPSYMEELNRKRIRRNISARGLWPRDKKINLKEHPYLGIGGGHLRENRYTPKDMTWDMSYWLYQDSVAFISSERELFGFVVRSRDFANLMRSQFEQIWKISEPIPPQPEYTDSFLDSV